MKTKQKKEYYNIYKKLILQDLTIDDNYFDIIITYYSLHDHNLLKETPESIQLHQDVSKHLNDTYTKIKLMELDSNYFKNLINWSKLEEYLIDRLS